jgi:hypothetical protein
LSFRPLHKEWALRVFYCVLLVLSASVTQAAANLAEVRAAARQAHVLLLEATKHREAKEFEAAAGALRKLKEINGLPGYLAQRAEGLMAEINRIEADLPARDETSSRIQLPHRRPPAITFYIAPDGSDRNPGTKDKPFASLIRARDAVRAARKAGRLERGGAVVELLEGTYRTTETLELTEEDSGRADAPLVFRSATGTTATLSGGVRLAEFKPVADAGVRARLTEAVRDKVVQVDLKAMGIEDFGELYSRGFQLPINRPVTELFFDEKAMRLARWPNTGFVQTGRVLAGSSTSRGIGDYGAATFEFKNERLARWAQARDAFVFGYWRWSWADATLRVAAIDAKAGRLRLADASPYGTLPNQPFYFFNLLEEIDQPGEWYLDRTNGVLYFYPPSDPAQARVELSLFDGPFFRLKGASHIVFEQLTLELGRGTGIEIEGGGGVLVAGSTLRKLGGDAVLISQGKGHGILSCDLHTLARGGVRVQAGNRKTLESCEHFVENCHIYNFSRVDRTYTPAVHVHGVGLRVSHNRIHDSPGHGLRIDGNDHLVQFNRVFRVATETDDQGGLDTWGDSTYRGIVIQYNHWHDIGPRPRPGLTCGGAGIRLDDGICGVLIYGNVFVRSSGGKFGGIQIHGGKDNWVDNNVFFDCRIGISFSRWGAGRWRTWLGPGQFGDKVRTMNITKPPYSERYPELARLHSAPDVNHVWRNIIFRCGQPFLNDGGIQDMIANLITREDPGFVDAAGGDFRLKPDAGVVQSHGFHPIPFHEIGLYKDAWRTRKPTASEATPDAH